MNWVRRRKLNRALLVDWIANDVHDTAQCPAADRNRNRSASVYGLHASHKAVGRLHGHRTHAAFTQVLLNLGHDVDGRYFTYYTQSSAKQLYDSDKRLECR